MNSYFFGEGSGSAVDDNSGVNQCLACQGGDTPATTVPFILSSFFVFPFSFSFFWWFLPGINICWVVSSNHNCLVRVIPMLAGLLDCFVKIFLLPRSFSSPLVKAPKAVGLDYWLMPTASHDISFYGSSDRLEPFDIRLSIPSERKQKENPRKCPSHTTATRASSAATGTTIWKA